MGEIVRISEGGMNRSFEGVNKLRTQLSGGGNCLWVPSHTIQLVSKTVTQNGEYLPSNDGAYAYSQAVVNVNAEVNSLCGIDTDDKYKWVRSHNGVIYTSELPSEIRVTTPPTKNSYMQGQSVNYSGMVVKAYDEGGNLWTSPEYPNGIVPNSELIFPHIKVDRNSMPFCWGDKLKYWGNRDHPYVPFPPFEPIYYSYYRAGETLTSKEYFSDPTYGLDYMLYTFTAENPVYVIHIYKKTDNDKEWAENIKQKLIEHNEMVDGWYPSIGMDSLLFSTSPFEGTVTDLTMKENGEIYKEKIVSRPHNLPESFSYVGIDDDNYMYSHEIDRDIKNHLDQYREVKQVYYSVPWNLGAARWCNIHDRGIETRLNTNEGLVDNIYETFKRSPDSFYEQDVVPILGYLLLYQHNFVVDGIGWHRPGDNLLLTTHFPITVN